MAIEAFDRAQLVLAKLQTSDDFEHVGRDSRGIRIQTDSFVEGIAGLCSTFPHYDQALILMGALIKVASADYGTYVRVKNLSSAISVDVRGLVGPMEDNPDFEELQKMIRRRSGISLQIDSQGRNWISAHTDFLEYEGRSLGEVINGKLKQFPDGQRAELASGFFDVVASEVAQSGEFLDL